VSVNAILFPLLVAAIPQLTGPVVDQAGLLSTQDRQTIADGLHRYQQQTGNQLQVLIVRSLPEGVPIEEFTIRVAEEWKLGTAEKDNGVLLAISVADRKWRIEVGGGLEGELTDVESSRIGRELLVPAMRRGEYAGAVAGTLQRIAGEIGGSIDFGRPIAVRTPQRRPVGGVLPLIIFALIILFLGRRRGGGFLAGMVLGNMLGGGYRGGGGGGGGWSGGGGGFSGGGAGGDW
jgi:uncharacterized protein